MDIELNNEIRIELSRSDDGQLTKSSAAATNYTRRRLREGSLARRIQTPTPISEGDLDNSLKEDLFKIFEMEPASPGATTVNFNQSADTFLYTGDKYAVSLFNITTREYAKNTRELMTYKNDLQEIFSENALKDISTEEDTRYWALVDSIVGSTANSPAPSTGVVQYQSLTGGLTRVNWEAGVNFMQQMAPNNPMNTGVVVVNRKTLNQFAARLTAQEIGFNWAESTFRKGAAAIEEGMIFNKPHLATIKANLVPDNVMYTFAEPDYLGQFLVLEEPVMIVSKKQNIIRFSACETIGFAIANNFAVAKTIFTT